MVRKKGLDTGRCYRVTVTADGGAGEDQDPVRLSHVNDLPCVRDHLIGIATARGWVPCSPTLDEVAPGRATWRMCDGSDPARQVAVTTVRESASTLVC